MMQHICFVCFMVYQPIILNRFLSNLQDQVTSLIFLGCYSCGQIPLNLCAHFMTVFSSELVLIESVDHDTNCVMLFTLKVLPHCVSAEWSRVVQLLQRLISTDVLPARTSTPEHDALISEGLQQVFTLMINVYNIQVPKDHPSCDLQMVCIMHKFVRHQLE